MPASRVFSDEMSIWKKFVCDGSLKYAPFPAIETL